jgi:hypothetical protein
VKITVPIFLFSWPVVVLALFAWLPPRRAAIAAFLVGWLFLPISSFKLPGLPEYSKIFATNASVLLAILVFD